MTLKEQIEQDLGIPVTEHVWVKGMQNGVAPTGEWYVSITHAGPKDEGQKAGVWCESQEIAQELLMNAIREYAREVMAGKTGDFILYWREEPSVEKWGELPVYVPELTFRGEYKYVLRPFVPFGGFARLLISNTAVKERAA